MRVATVAAMANLLDRRRAPPTGGARSSSWRWRWRRRSPCWRRPAAAEAPTGRAHRPPRPPRARRPPTTPAPGPYPVGTAKLTIGDGQAVYLYYPADPARLDEGTPVTGYSSADAFPAAFRAIVPAQLVQQIPLDATLDAPVADGPFPVVLYSHGFASYPEYSAQHLAHLASWGFVTAAPDHTSRDLAAAALAAASLGTRRRR